MYYCFYIHSSLWLCNICVTGSDKTYQWLFTVKVKFLLFFFMCAGEADLYWFFVYLLMSFFPSVWWCLFHFWHTEGQWGHLKHSEDKGKSCNEDSLQICMYPCVNTFFLSSLCVSELLFCLWESFFCCFLFFNEKFLLCFLLISSCFLYRPKTMPRWASKK